MHNEDYALYEYILLYEFIHKLVKCQYTKALVLTAYNLYIYCRVYFIEHTQLCCLAI